MPVRGSHTRVAESDQGNEAGSRYSSPDIGELIRAIAALVEKTHCPVYVSKEVSVCDDQPSPAKSPVLAASRRHTI